MSDPNNHDPYAAVLADLLAQRDRIDTAIAAIEDLRGAGMIQRRVAAEVSETPVSMGAGAFLGMSIPDAAKKLLASERRAMGNPEIWEKLKAGGLHLNSIDPVNTVGSVLSRRFDKTGDIVRVGRGTWGLAEWYPGRSFKSSKSEVATTQAATLPADLGELLGADPEVMPEDLY